MNEFHEISEMSLCGRACHGSHTSPFHLSSNRQGDTLNQLSAHLCNPLEAHDRTQSRAQEFDGSVFELSASQALTGRTNSRSASRDRGSSTVESLSSLIPSTPIVGLRTALASVIPYQSNCSCQCHSLSRWGSPEDRPLGPKANPRLRLSSLVMVLEDTSYDLMQEAYRFLPRVARLQIPILPLLLVVVAISWYMYINA